jgi:insertion element IS1 protein InsB
MGIIDVGHKDINVNIVMQYLCGSMKKKEKQTNHRNKKMILDCYSKGMGVRSICRVFKIATKTLKKWVSKEGKEFKQPDISQEKFVSCDEMWTFVQKKKQKAWIWLVYSKMTKKILAVHIGDRGKNSAKKLIEQVPNMKIYCTDNWDAYNCAIEDQNLREIGKRNTQDIERFNLNMRLWLARLVRKTIKFSKSLEMLKASVNLVVNKYNDKVDYQLLRNT